MNLVDPSGGGGGYDDDSSDDSSDDDFSMLEAQRALDEAKASKLLKLLRKPVNPRI